MESCVLRDDGTRIEYRPVLSDVVAVHVPEDSPRLKQSVKGLVARPRNSLQGCSRFSGTLFCPGARRSRCQPRHALLARGS
jgi:hypothetical protein